MIAATGRNDFESIDAVIDRSGDADSITIDLNGKDVEEAVAVDDPDAAEEVKASDGRRAQTGPSAGEGPRKDSTRSSGEARRRSRKEAVAVVALLLGGAIAAAVIMMWPPPERTEMDGEFDDWAGIDRIPDDRGDAGDSEDIDIVGSAIRRDGSFLDLYLETAGAIFPPEGATVHVFMDVDVPSNGYSVMGMGADYLVEAYGEDGAVIVAAYYRHYGSSADRRHLDWGNWSFVDEVRAGNDGRRLEMRLPYHNGGDAVALFHISDSEGNEDFSILLPIELDPEMAPLFVSGGALVDEGDILQTGETTLASLTLEAVGGSTTVRTVLLRNGGNAADGDIGTATISDPEGAVGSASFNDGIAAVPMGDRRVDGTDVLTISIDIPDTATPSRVLALSVASVATDSNAVTYLTCGCAWYLVSFPPGHVVDGLFAEWGAGATEDPVGDAHDDIDITRFKAAREADTFFYLRVSGDMMAGTWVPERSPMVVPVPSGTGDLGIPTRTGENVAYVFLEVQPAIAGFAPEGFPITANRMLEIRGIDGEVTLATYHEFDGASPEEWSWTPLDVPTEALAGGSELEASVTMDMGDFRAYFHLVNWRNGTGDFGETAVDLLGGEDDPFVVTIDGATYQSLTGENWTAMSSPGAGATFVDIQAGSGTTAGYAYALMSDGRVFVTRSSVDGWYQYGYGAPSIPDTDTYVALALGSGTTAGYVYALRSDGAVFVSRNAVEGWSRYGYRSPSLPESHAYVDIAAGSGTTAGYAYVLRNDGRVFFTPNAVSGWGSYGYGSPALPAATSYCAIAAGSGTTAGYMYVLRNDGVVRVAQNGVSGWYAYGYGSPAIPSSQAYVDIASDSKGDLFVLRNDGGVYFADTAVGGWSRYGYGDDQLPTSTSYAAIAAGADGTLGYAYVLRNDGMAYVATSAVAGWYRYGYGSPSLPHPSCFVDIASDTEGIYALRSNGSVYRSADGTSWSHLADAGADGSWTSLASSHAGTLFALRNDGRVVRVSTSTGATSSWGDSGPDTSWTSIASDGTYVYALMANGQVACSSTLSASWDPKGDCGPGSAWTSIGALTGVQHVYAMRNDRAVRRALAGSSTTWNAWAPAGNDTCWVSIAVGAEYVFALRADGRVDRATQDATPTWSEAYGEVGDDGATGLDTVVGELAFMLLPVLVLAAVTMAARRRTGRGPRSTSRGGEGR